MVMQPFVHRGLPRKDARASVHYRSQIPSRVSRPIRAEITFIVFPKKEKELLLSENSHFLP